MKNYNKIMKNYNKILEAVNRGIKLALDDIEDVNSIGSTSQKNDIIDNDDTIKIKIDLMKEVVDLGLPSGTLWCKYNLGVNSNKLKTAKQWYGDYYAWGDLERNKTNKDGKIYFRWNNYKFGKNIKEITKYCNNPKYGLNGFTDNLTELLPEDDAAYQNKKLHNFKFHIPTKEQCKELINYTKNYWVKNYDPNKLVHNPKNDKGIRGLNGSVFIGQNGNQLFIPAAGYRFNSDIFYVGSECHLWSSSLNLYCPAFACFFNFHSDNFDIDIHDRCDGLSVRPVINL